MCNIIGCIWEGGYIQEASMFSVIYEVSEEVSNPDPKVVPDRLWYGIMKQGNLAAPTDPTGQSNLHSACLSSAPEERRPEHR